MVQSFWEDNFVISYQQNYVLQQWFLENEQEILLQRYL